MSSSFEPMKGFSNPHFQTILPTLLNQNEKPEFVHERLELEDDDFLDLAWHRLPTEDERPIIIIFHGLEGSIYSPYAFRQMRALDARGFNAVVMHLEDVLERLTVSHVLIIVEKQVMPVTL